MPSVRIADHVSGVRSHASRSAVSVSLLVSYALSVYTRFTISKCKHIKFPAMISYYGWINRQSC